MNKTEIVFRNPELLQERVRDLVTEHGGLRGAARYIGCDVAYVSRMLDGTRPNPGAPYLEKLGLRKILTWERA